MWRESSYIYILSHCSSSFFPQRNSASRMMMMVTSISASMMMVTMAAIVAVAVVGCCCWAWHTPHEYEDDTLNTCDTCKVEYEDKDMEWFFGYQCQYWWKHCTNCMYWWRKKQH